MRGALVPSRFVFEVRDLCVLCSHSPTHTVKAYLARSPLKFTTKTLLGVRPVFMPYCHRYAQKTHSNVENTDPTLANFFLHHLFLVNYKNEFYGNLLINILISTYHSQLFGVSANLAHFFGNRKGSFFPVRWAREFYWYERVKKEATEAEILLRLLHKWEHVSL